MADEIARGNEDSDTYQQGSEVEGDDERNVQLYGHRTDVIGLRVEFYEPCPFLQEDAAQCDEVAPEESSADDEGCKPKEDVTYLSVVRTERFQYADHLCAFEDDDQQSGNHRDTGNGGHECKNDPHVHVHQVEP